MSAAYPYRSAFKRIGRLRSTPASANKSAAGAVGLVFTIGAGFTTAAPA